MQTSIAPKFYQNKICSRCRKSKPLDTFYHDRCAKDGRQRCCKECQAAYKKVYYQTEAGKATQRRSNQSKAGKAAMRKYRLANPEKRKAQNVIRSAVRCGDLPRVFGLRCQVCGDRAQHRHHSDYNKPMETTPLCHKHHWQAHNSQEET